MTKKIGALFIDLPITNLFFSRSSTHNTQDKESSIKNACDEKKSRNNFISFTTFGFGPDNIN